jgi:probable H4MPT-linked C1 transfer pathway protein
MSIPILGLDIGGANLKAAHTNGMARTAPFALWKHPERLAAELIRLCADMPRFDRLAVTMTGELCDCFATRREGVEAILRQVRMLEGTGPIRVWSTNSTFLNVDEAARDPFVVAAANWLALANLIARRFAEENILLVDAGSTTTDIVYLERGTPAPRGRTDPERLATGELVYTGVRRTPICAVLGMHVAAEFFATMFDAYLIAGLIPEAPNDCDTADGRPATRAGAHARLARLRCADVESFVFDDACALADRALETQWITVAAAIERVLHGRRPVERVVLSGSGEVLARHATGRASQVRAIPVTSVADLLGPALSEAACAYAVAILAAQEFDHER